MIHRALFTLLCALPFLGCDTPRTTRCRTDCPGADDADGSVPPPHDAGAPADAAVTGGRCTVAPVASPFEAPSAELRWRGAGLPFPAYEQVLSTPVVIDFIEDGPDDFVPELIFVSYQAFGAPGVLRVVSGRAPHATLMTIAGDGSPPGAEGAAPSLLGDAHPAAADIDGDGRVEVVALLHGGGAIALRSDGSELWRADASVVPLAASGPNGAVAIADLDQDGRPEVIVGSLVLDGPTGALRWQGGEGRGNNAQGPISCVADVVPSSPGLEVIAGRTAYSASGDVLWTLPAAEGDGFCAVADIVDAEGRSGRDGRPEVIRVAGGVVTILDGASGDTRWSRPLPPCGRNGQTGRGGAPTVADFDGDGRMEIGVAGAYCYSVLDVGCAGPGDGCTGEGLLWRAATEDNSSNVTSSTVFDFNGDGIAEVVYNDELYFRVLSGPTGEVLFEEPNPSRTRTEQPIVADVDADGNAEIIFGANDEAAFAGEGLDPEQRVPGLEIWSSADDSWVAARPIWNQHTYHIDNVGIDGRVPRVESPSWASHNTYRQNLAGEDALAAPDLRVAGGGSDEGRCGEGVLVVCADVANGGDAVVGPDVEVVFTAGGPAGEEIGRARTTRTLSPREGSERVCVEWPGAPREAPVEVWARIDPTGSVRECVEDNNVGPIGELICGSVR